MESYKKIFTDLQLPDTFSEYLTLSLDDNDLVIYACSLGSNVAFRVTVEVVVAFHVYEEFCHPDMDRPTEFTRPPFSNESKAIYYPALEVLDSGWINSVSENRLREHRRESAKHYQFLSYSNVIDVISNQEPKASVIPYSEYENIKSLIRGKFT